MVMIIIHNSDSALECLAPSPPLEQRALAVCNENRRNSASEASYSPTNLCLFLLAAQISGWDFHFTQQNQAIQPR